MLPDAPPAAFWLPVPCGHPPFPVAWLTFAGPACHCGWLLNDAEVVEGRVVACSNCGCHPAIPEERDA